MILLGCTNASEKDSRVDVLPYFNEASFTPHWLSPNDAALKGFHSIPPFELVNQEGDTITEQTIENKIFIVDFFFTTCPGICPKMTTNMAVLQKEFLEDDDVILLSHSVTPEIDSIPTLKTYADAKGVMYGKWHLLTGERKLIYDLGRNYYFVEEDLGVDKDETDFLHTENFVLVDQDKHIRGIYNGLNKTSVDQLVIDIKTLQKEKG